MLKIASPSLSPSESNKRYDFQHLYPQPFLLPYPIVRYIAKHPPSGRIWKKLIHTCKYFWQKHPIYPVECLRLFLSANDLTLKWTADEKIFNSKSTVPKLWLYDKLYANSRNFTPSLISKSLITTKNFTWNLQRISLDNQILTLDEYLILTSSGLIKSLSFFGNTAVTNPLGEIVTFDKLLENLQNLEYLSCSCNYYPFESDTVIRMTKHLSNFKKLRFFGLYYLTHFDFPSFKEFLMKTEKVKVELFFGVHLTVGYKILLEEFLSDMIKNPPAVIPVLHFYGYDRHRFEEYEKLLLTQK